MQYLATCRNFHRECRDECRSDLRDICCGSSRLKNEIDICPDNLDKSRRLLSAESRRSEAVNEPQELSSCRKSSPAVMLPGGRDAQLIPTSVTFAWTVHRDPRASNKGYVFHRQLPCRCCFAAERASRREEEARAVVIIIRISLGSRGDDEARSLIAEPIRN